ncbi:MAG: hypothetical protein ACHQ01_04085, partial [Candidatus Limnocylindrales bacterium]
APPAPSLPAPTPSGPSGIQALAGLTEITPPLSHITTSWLPLQITSRSIGIIGLRLFYIVGGDRIESSVIGADADPQTLVNVPRCQAINQLAAAGNTMAYVVTSPAGAAAEIGGCGGLGQVSWSLWLLDLSGGGPKQVASGVRDAGNIDFAEFPIRVALTDTAYAFNRPPTTATASPTETVEVHSIEGHMLWSSRIDASVTGVMLGGSSLAILTGSSGASGPFDLWTSDPNNPEFMRVAVAASSASISPDGSYLTWDLTTTDPRYQASPRPTVGIETIGSGQVAYLTTPTTSDLPEGTHPAVSSTVRGPVVAWFATAPGGTVYPAFRFAAGGGAGVFESVQLPVWLDVEGSSLIWVAESRDGWSAMAFAIDLATLAPI